MADLKVGSVWAVLTAAGTGVRFGADTPKALVRVDGKALLVHALETLLRVPGIQGVVVTVTPGQREIFERELAAAVPEYLPAGSSSAISAHHTVAPGFSWGGFPGAGFSGSVFSGASVAPLVTVVEGGASRQDSVRRGLARLRDFAVEMGRALEPVTPILIHDAARPFAPLELMERLVQAVVGGNVAVVPGLPVADTIKEVQDAQLPPGGSLVVQTPRRETLRAIQTPQIFRWETIWVAHQQLCALGEDDSTALTDDAALVERLGGVVRVIEGDPLAYKITVPADLERGR